MDTLAPEKEQGAAALPCATLFIAGNLNAHWRRNVLPFAGPLQTFQLVDGVRQLAIDRSFVAQDEIKVLVLV